MKYEIKTIYLDAITKKMARLEKKAKKYNNAFTFEIVDNYNKEKKAENGCTYIVNYTVINVEGTIKNENWEFVGTIEHHNARNIIKLFKTNIVIPEHYYYNPPICEHCKTNRNRKDTYIIQNIETKEFKQIGKSCLNDYSGLNAEWTALYWQEISNIEHADEIFAVDFNGSIENCYSIADVLKNAFAITDLFGYVKSSEENSTKWKLITAMYGTSAEQKIEKINSINPDNYEKITKDCINWITDYNGNNDYLLNLKTICLDGYVNRKNYGYIASMPNAYHKEIERKTAYAEKIASYKTARINSDYIGTIKDRVTLAIESMRVITSFETDFGITRIYEFLDNNGNVIIWKTSKYIDNHNKPFEIVGTVKTHKDYNGIKQTELTRCKINGNGIEIY